MILRVDGRLENARLAAAEILRRCCTEVSGSSGTMRDLAALREWAEAAWARCNRMPIVCAGALAASVLFFLLWLLLDAIGVPAGSQWLSWLFVGQVLCFFVGFGAGAVVLSLGVSVLAVG